MAGQSESDSAWIPKFRRALNQWYDRHHRKLPWRETHDPYAIWVSEVMLQQTQVATVIDYFHRFLKRFPTVDRLAAADEQEVLQLWSGLGYYRRARQLHAAAKKIVDQFEGVFPNDLAEIASLPGIGRYTAGAVASFAFDQRAPIVEANTVRLFCRLLAEEELPTDALVQKRLWGFSESLLPKKKGSGLLNQALIELGSQVCLPQAPKCLICPVQKFCKGRQAGIESRIPASKTREAPTPLVHGVVVIREGGQVLLRQNEPGEWWAGLWDFPRVELPLEASPTTKRETLRTQENPKSDLPNRTTKKSTSKAETTRGQYGQIAKELKQNLKSKFELNCEPDGHLKTIRHAVTRYKISLHCFSAATPSPIELHSLPGKWAWASLASHNLPLTATANRLLLWITDTPPNNKLS